MLRGNTTLLLGDYRPIDYFYFFFIYAPQEGSLLQGMRQHFR